MIPVVIAYVAVWLGVVFYLAKLAAGQRRLTRALEALENRLAETERVQPPLSHAA